MCVGTSERAGPLPQTVRARGRVRVGGGRVGAAQCLCPSCLLPGTAMPSRRLHALRGVVDEYLHPFVKPRSASFRFRGAGSYKLRLRPACVLALRLLVVGVIPSEFFSLVGKSASDHDTGRLSDYGTSHILWSDMAEATTHAECIPPTDSALRQSHRIPDEVSAAAPQDPMA